MRASNCPRLPQSVNRARNLLVGEEVVVRRESKLSNMAGPMQSVQAPRCKNCTRLDVN